MAETDAATRTDEDADEALMLRYAAGDAGAFDTLYARHKGALYRFILRQCRNEGRAEELFQDVWMKAIGARERYRPEAKFRTWLFTIAHNALMDHFRKQSNSDAPAIVDEEGESVVVHLPAARTSEPLVMLASKKTGEAILRALEQLPAAQREVFLLYQEGEMSVEDIAKTTGVGFEAAKSRLRYAVAKLRELLQAEHGREVA
ncbi:MAG: RNA polymerase sigma factor [Betaproteobacteria bacterium]|nr:RNA polymerase sigma factor [Betaproteobacteria bacterium]